jgi:hypothetical protein
MLPKERETLEVNHSELDNTFVKIGNRTAVRIGHYTDWETAQVVAFYVATQWRMRCYVIKCEKHGRWMVWRTNVTCRVRTREEVIHCRQCGNRYGSRACGPSHALQAHRLQLTGVPL